MTHTPPNPDEPRTDADEAHTDAAIRDLNARVQWPQAPSSTPPSASWPETGPNLSPPSRPPSQPAPRPQNAWRSAGIGALGLVGGVLLALIVQDILATLLVRDGTIPTGLTVVFGFLMPVFAILGAVIAVLIYNRIAKRQSEGGRR